jgi:hypothetical protein
MAKIKTITAPDKFDRVMERAEEMDAEELLDTLQEAMSYLDDRKVSQLLSYIADRDD